MKLVITDLDGTLLNDESLISEETKRTIQNLINSGVNFAIATGRGLKSTKVFRDIIGHNIFLICNNGANIYDKDENLIYEKYISEVHIKKIITYLKEKGIAYNGFYNDCLFLEDGIITKEKNFNTITLKDKNLYPKMTKILIKDKPETIIKLQKDMIKKFSDYLDITISSETTLDLVHKDCSKGNAIKLISKKLNIPFSEIMAFGDGGNDFDMLNIVGHAVIMENALTSLKKTFEHKTLKNTENGVAEYLKNYFNLK